MHDFLGVQRFITDAPKDAFFVPKAPLCALEWQKRDFGICLQFNAKTGVSPFAGGPWARPGGPRTHRTHGARCVPGTSQASAEAENDEVAIFSGACGGTQFVGVGGAKPAHGMRFSCVGGGPPAGFVLRLSVTKI